MGATGHGPVGQSATGHVYTWMESKWQESVSIALFVRGSQGTSKEQLQRNSKISGGVKMIRKRKPLYPTSLEVNRAVSSKTPFLETEFCLPRPIT